MILIDDILSEFTHTGILPGTIEYSSITHEDNDVEIAAIFNCINACSNLWATIDYNPWGNNGASYVQIECFQSNDPLASRLRAAPRDFVYTTLKRPKRLTIWVSRTARIAIYGTGRLENKENIFALPDDSWRPSIEIILTTVKTSDFYIPSLNTLNRLLEFPIPVNYVQSNFSDGLMRVFDYFFEWID